MKKSIIMVLLLVSQLTYALNSALFNVSVSGNQTTRPINIVLCLNGKGPLSCQSYTVNQPTLSITTTIPNHTYVAAGIKISSTDVNVTSISGCVPYSNGYCLFTVSSTQAAHIAINTPIPPTAPPPIAFLSQTSTPGDMSNNPQSLKGLAGANALCNADAQMYGTPAVKAHSSYKALLIASNSTPCSQVNSVSGCAGIYASPLWPLKPGVIYYNPDGITPFNTVTSNAVFPDTSPQGAPFPALTSVDGSIPAPGTNFWFGTQSNYITGPAGSPFVTEITGWAYENLANSPSYSANLHLCYDQEDWASQAVFVFGAYGMTENPFHCGGFQCGPTDTWQNYYSGDLGSIDSDTFSAGNYQECNLLKNIVCVSSQ